MQSKKVSTLDRINTKYGNAKIHHGYYWITSRKEGNNGDQLHRLIWEDAYDLKIPNGCLIHHIDKNSMNNDLNNLRIMTYEEHAKLHNTNKKINEEDVKEIREEKLWLKLSQNQIGDLYGVSRHIIHRIIYSKTWKDDDYFKNIKVDKNTGYTQQGQQIIVLKCVMSMLKKLEKKNYI
ncbi:MAG: HNH endonuclease [Methanobrevibacter sp.]|nr:HNH endonuclease [Methanobrevibacter sp.]